ncbi:MAG TPA: collagenase-like protease [Sutterella sp.]|nr:collagenase-like protease [Sutterella sp.]
MQRKELELMAPAGSWEALSAACAAGADSVYFGAGVLNMRSHSGGRFTPEDIGQVCRRCHDAGVKAYLTLNSVMFDEDRTLLRKTLDLAAEKGIDAVIACDPDVLVYARERSVPVHLSTQLNISNLEALRFYAPYADVAVLARELNLDQVREICRGISREDIRGVSGRPMRIEMFCHGALCMAVSGKCYMSLATRGRSANRGECLQTCRREYVFKDVDRNIEIALENGYFMSPKDLKTIGFLDRMVESGVRVFKIEGRARGPEYVRTVVECYDEALGVIAAGEWSQECRTRWDERLATVFNRGFWDGYYLGAEVAELCGAYGSKATERKVYVGECANYFAKAGVGQFALKAGGLALGDKLLVTGPTTGAVYCTAERIVTDDGRDAQSAVKGDLITLPVPVKVRERDKLYRVEQAAASN